MRIIPFVLLFISVLTTESRAQISEGKDAPVVKIKEYHLPKSGDFNTWDIGGHFGFTYPFSDISASGKRDMGYGIDVTKFLSHSFAIQSRFMRANLSGVDVNKPQYGFNTTIDYDISLNALFQIGNISFLRGIPKLAIYGSIGFGVIHYSPDIYLDGGNNILNGIYSQYSEPFDTMNYHNSSDYVIPYCAGIKYRVSKSVSLNAEYSFRKTNTDKLDGFFKLLSEDDDYSYYSLGITIHLGRNDKVLEWVNPLQIVYDDLYDMKDKVDLITKDSDHDGVADLFDREPDTPPGTKVYGDGTSIDTDGDGVPDRLDAEPYSVRNAKVDASGKEIVESKELTNEIKDTSPAITKKTNSRTKKETVHVPPSRNVNTPSDASNVIGNNFLPSIYFAFDDDQINPKYEETLAGIAQVIINNPEFKFEIIGNCDGIANADYNRKLGMRRAESVKNYLVVNFHINPAILTIGSSDPNEPQEGPNALKRRVDFIVSE